MIDLLISRPYHYFVMLKGFGGTWFFGFTWKVGQFLNQFLSFRDLVIWLKNSGDGRLSWFHMVFTFLYFSFTTVSPNLNIQIYSKTVATKTFGQKKTGP